MSVTIRPLCQEDASALARFMDEEVKKYLPGTIPEPYTHEDAKAFVFFSRGKGSSGRDFAIDFDGCFCGVISIDYGLDVWTGNGKLGFWLGKEYWGKGIAAKAIAQMVEFAFNKRGLRRVYSEVMEENDRCRRALEKAGLTCEAVLKDAIIKDGKIMDCRVFSRLYNS